MNIKLPYVFVCDNAYPLKHNMMKLYLGAHLTREQDIFNGHLSRARQYVECAFGIMANKLRILFKSIETNENSSTLIVNCAAVLHNTIIDKEGIDEMLMKAVLQEVQKKEFANMSMSCGRHLNLSLSTATAIRKYFTEYFNSPAGSVDWQDRYVKS